MKVIKACAGAVCYQALSLSYRRSKPLHIQFWERGAFIRGDGIAYRRSG